jgi:cation diffusion facilitator CzcD-associated flavoprotein CzcO
VHSAKWDHSYDYSDKRIAVIGNGSSGIQILPQLAKLEGTDVTSFQRGPTWVIARMSAAKLLGRDDISPNPEYTEEDKRRFTEDPKYHNEYRKQLIHRINRAFRMVFPRSVLTLNSILTHPSLSKVHLQIWKQQSLPRNRCQINLAMIQSSAEN